LLLQVDRKGFHGSAAALLPSLHPPGSLRAAQQQRPRAKRTSSRSWFKRQETWSSCRKRAPLHPQHTICPCKTRGARVFSFGLPALPAAARRHTGPRLAVLSPGPVPLPPAGARAACLPAPLVIHSADHLSRSPAPCAAPLRKGLPRFVQVPTRVQEQHRSSRIGRRSLSRRGACGVTCVASAASEI